MSQDPSSSGDAEQGRSSHRSAPGGSSRPGFMTVGTGSTSESAAKLAALLEEDSGYGGSIVDGDGMSSGWHPGLTEDRPTPSITPTRQSGSSADAENDRRALASHVHQLYYNQNKTALGRAINRTVETLKRLREMNAQWPAHYPSVNRPDQSSPTSPMQRPQRPPLGSSQSTYDHVYESASPTTERPGLPRAGTYGGPDAESSSTAAHKPPQEPRLVSVELAQDFSILKLDLKMGHASQSELVHSLEKHSIASLLDGQISKSIKHLYSLRERIEDTSSKVLVTGDLNAGKSTFCNALLRRKVLPEDQQPCTSIFCEVLDFNENGGVEEVHAVPIGHEYHRDDERTYRVFALQDLEAIVLDNEHYSQCKVYIQDIRSVDASLLNNGVVDIALIDAPGLNMDSVKTTAVFARQEEIDVVVFVVSAANHFTQSAKEFIFNAAREKAYIFMVVNGFDNIRDQRRCQELILKQVRHLSPATFKESSELVHFVSSNAIPTAGPSSEFVGGGGGASSGGAGSGSGPGGPDGDGDDADDGTKHGDPGPPGGKGKGKEKEKMEDFEELEASLRRFVLEKRARSKLAPAKTYLLNVLSDLNHLATVNRGVAQSELDRVTKELAAIESEYEQSTKARTEVSEHADQNIETTVTEVYEHTRDHLNTTISRVAEHDLGIPYVGLLRAFDYADDLKAAMLAEIASTVERCEEHARRRTTEGVNVIKTMGLRSLGDAYTDFTFRGDMMFKRRKDAIARQVDVEEDVWDFFDVASLWERQETVVGSSMAVTVAGVVGTRMVGGLSWVNGAVGAMRIVGSNNVRRLIVPGVVAVLILGVSYALSTIPQSLPRRLSNKLAAQLSALDYTHSNALRISSEVRRALKYPADNLRVGLQRGVERLQGRREETDKVKVESEVARKYFGNLLRDASEIAQGVRRVDLEGPAPGIAGSYAA